MTAPTPKTSMIVTGWQQEDGLVYIKLPAGKYKLGENVFTLPYNGGEQIIDNDHLDELYQIIESRRIAKYENVDTKEVLGVEAFIRQKQELDVKEWDEIAEENRWPSITARHAYELFAALWQPVYEPVVEFNKVQILVEGQAPKNDHPFIRPIRKISGDLTNTLYEYSKNAHIVSVVEYYLKKNGWRPLDQEPPSVSNPKDMDKTYWIKGTLEYSRLFPSKEAGSKYMTIEIPGLKKFEKIVGRSTGKFDELEAIYKVNDEEIRSIMGAFFNKSKALAEVDVDTIGKVLSGLEALSRNIYGIDSMKKTQSEYNQARKGIDELLRVFRKAVS